MKLETTDKTKALRESTSQGSSSVEKMRLEIEALEQRNRSLEAELAAREEVMLSLFSFIESNQKSL